MGAHGSQERILDLLELELEVVVTCLVWVLGTKCGPLEEQQAPLAPEHPSHRSTYTLHGCTHAFAFTEGIILQPNIGMLVAGLLLTISKSKRGRNVFCA